MTIPQNEPFETVFSALTLVEPKGVAGVFESVVVIPETPSDLRSPTTRAYAQVQLWIRTDSGLSAEAVLNKVEGELRAVGHAANRGIASAVLAVFSLIRNGSGTAVAQFQELLAGAHLSDVSQWFVLPALAPPMPRRRLGPFQIGPLDTETMAYRMKKAGCDYFERDGHRLKGCLTFERDPFPTTILPVCEASESAPAIRHQTSGVNYLILDHYFHSVADLLFEEFFRAFEEEQALRVAIGFGYANMAQMQVFPGVERVSLYSKVRQDRRGWGCPTRIRPTSDVGALDKALPESVRFLSRFGIGAFGPSALDRTTRTFARFLTRAARLLTSDDWAEAFLYHIIALDLLLGERDASTRTVATRAAVLVYKPLAQPFELQKKTIERLYDARSKFVHEGQAPNVGCLDEASQVTLQVMYCLLRLNRFQANHTQDFMKLWLRELDLLRATLEVGRAPAFDDLSRCGIELTEEDRERPRFDFRGESPN